MIALNTQQKIAAIQSMHRQREDLLRAQTGLTLRIKAICRRAVPETEKHKAGDKTEADKLYKALMSGSMIALHIAASAQHIIESRAMLAPHIKEITRSMEKTASSLPVAPFVTSIHGFGFLGLAQIIGEAGDLSHYANPGKLWKRFGLAPRGGKAMSQWRRTGGLDALEWQEAGYSPRRRAVVFSIGDSLLKKQNGYRDLYLERKDTEKAKAPDLPPMAHHRRAQRYMEKRLLRELWSAWRNPEQIAKAA